MGKYKTNLMDKIENTNNQIKWLIIVISAILALIIIFWGIYYSDDSESTNSMPKVVFEPIEKATQPTIKAENSNIKNNIKNDKKENTKIDKTQKKKTSKPKQEKIKPKQKLKKKFENSFNGYKIEGVIISKNESASTVFLKKGDDVKKLNIGDVLNGYIIKEIHRTYIILNNGKDTIHLNKIN